MKTQTPMTLLKDSFDTLNTLICKPIDLNKSSPKGYYSYESKGVESDFVRIYKLDDLNSFGFIFNGLDGKSGTILVNWKYSDKYLQRIFNFEDFKIRLKSFNKTLKILKSSKLINNTSTIKETFISMFDIQEGVRELNKVVDEVLIEINTELKDIRDKLSSSKLTLSEQKEDLSIVKEEYQIIKKHNETLLGIDKLEEELKEKKLILEDRLKPKFDELTALNKIITLSPYRIHKLESEFNSLSNDIIKKYPRHIRKAIQRKLKE